MNHTILATDEMKQQIEDLYLKAEDILEIAGTHKLRYSPWFRGIEREVERQMLWEMDNPAGMPSPQVRRDWEQYRELQEEFYIRLSKGLYGSGLQGQRKVAAVLAHIWLTLHRQFGLGGEFLCWLDLRFHVFMPLTAREKEELQAQRQAEDLAMQNPDAFFENADENALSGVSSGVFRSDPRSEREAEHFIQNHVAPRIKYGAGSAQAGVFSTEREQSTDAVLSWVIQAPACAGATDIPDNTNCDSFSTSTKPLPNKEFSPSRPDSFESKSGGSWDNPAKKWAPPSLLPFLSDSIGWSGEEEDGEGQEVAVGEKEAWPMTRRHRRAAERAAAKAAKKALKAAQCAALVATPSQQPLNPDEA